MFKILIVDDHPYARLAVRVLLDSMTGFKKNQIVGEASDGDAAIALVQELKPDLIILDIGLPRLDGLAVIKHVKKNSFPGHILVLSSYPDVTYSERCKRAGAQGFICKSGELNQIREAVIAIMRGETFFPKLHVSSVRSKDNTTSDLELIKTLTDRELFFTRKFASGERNVAVARLTGLNEKTVHSHKVNILRKLKLNDIVGLADFAKLYNLIS